MGADAAAHAALAAPRAHYSSLSLEATWRCHLRQEPSAVIPLAGIRGGGYATSSIPTPTPLPAPALPAQSVLGGGFGGGPRGPLRLSRGPSDGLPDVLPQELAGTLARQPRARLVIASALVAV